MQISDFVETHGWIAVEARGGFDVREEGLCGCQATIPLKLYNCLVKSGCLGAPKNILGSVQIFRNKKMVDLGRDFVRGGGGLVRRCSFRKSSIRN